MPIQFDTDFRYKNRREKGKYVSLKYGPILSGRILDVGADQCYLKEYLTGDVEYLGIGMGGNPDVCFDLETERLPYGDGTFDCVICLDVLEHLDNLHGMFAELCRVSKEYVILALPNCWGLFIQMLQRGDFDTSTFARVYGLPAESPSDRHKWFFSFEQAKEFLKTNSEKNRMDIVQLDAMNGPVQPKGIREVIQRFAWKILFPYADRNQFLTVKLWCVLRKRPATDKGK